MARDDKIIIRVSEEMKNNFQQLAESMGMTMSGLGAFVIGNYLREETYKREMQEKLLKDITPQFMDSINNIDLSDPRIAKAMEETFKHLATQNK